MAGVVDVVDPSLQSTEDDSTHEEACRERDFQEELEVENEQGPAGDPSSPAINGVSSAAITDFSIEIGDKYAQSASPVASPNAVTSASPVMCDEKSIRPMDEDSFAKGEDEIASESTDEPDLLEDEDLESVHPVTDEAAIEREVSQNVVTIEEETTLDNDVSDVVAVSDVPLTRASKETLSSFDSFEANEVGMFRVAAVQYCEVAMTGPSSPRVEKLVLDVGAAENIPPVSDRVDQVLSPHKPSSSTDEIGSDGVSGPEEEGLRLEVSVPLMAASAQELQLRMSVPSTDSNDAEAVTLEVAPVADVTIDKEQMSVTSVPENYALPDDKPQVMVVDGICASDDSGAVSTQPELPHENEEGKDNSYTDVHMDEIPTSLDLLGLQDSARSSVVAGPPESAPNIASPGHEPLRTPLEEREVLHITEDTMTALGVETATDAKAKTELEREMELYEASVMEEEAKILASKRVDSVSTGENVDDGKELPNDRKRALDSTPNEARKKRGKRVVPSETALKDEEDVCFICFDGGELVLCDRRSRHGLFEKKGAWICGWHFCTGCTKPANFQCYTCPTAFCASCLKKADFLSVRQRKGLCEECWPIVQMIENNETTNAEGVEVDFEDQETYECLYKDYWLDLKQRLQLTPAELDKNNKLGGSEYAENGDSDMEEKRDVEDYNSGSDSGESDDHEDRMEVSEDSQKRKRGKSKATRPSSPSALEVVTGADDEPYSVPNEGDGMEDVDDEDEDYTEEEGEKSRDGWASKELIDFVKFMDEDPKKPLKKFHVTKLLWTYIKSQKLQDPRKKTQILCDDRLQTLFGKKVVGQYEMIKYVQAHFTAKGSKSTRRSTVLSDETLKMDEDFNEEEVEEKYSKVRDVKDKRRRRKGEDDKFERPSVNEFAAITPKNINLIYLRRQLLEELLDDSEFDTKVCNTFVRIRVPGMVSKSEMCYRLVQVVGTRLQADHYKAGRKLTNVVLEILNLQKREDVTVDLVSNQDFTEEECQRLRQSIKCGLIKSLTVGDIEEKARDLQEAKVNDVSFRHQEDKKEINFENEWFETERQRLVNLRDRASEKGRKKELRECVEKLQELNSPAFRAAKLHARPEVSADPRMDPNYESDGNEDKLQEKYILMDGSERSPSAVGATDRSMVASGPVKSSLADTSRSDWDSQRSKLLWMENLRNREGERGTLESSRSNDKIVYGQVQNFAIDEASEKGYDRGWDKEWVMDERGPNTGTGWVGNGRNARTGTSERWNEKVNTIPSGDPGKPTRNEFRTTASGGGLGTPLYEGKPEWNKAREAPTVPAVQSSFPMAAEFTNTLSKAYEAVDKEKVWHYMDPTGTIQGPFSMEQLRKWNTTGYFPLDLRIWRTNQPRDEAVLLTDALAGRVQREKTDTWTSTSVRTASTSQQSLAQTATASGYTSKTAVDGWRDGGGGLASNWGDRSNTADAGRSSWGGDGGTRVLGRDSSASGIGDLKWKSGPASATTSSWESYSVSRSTSYGGSPTRSSRAEAAARFDPANWSTRTDVVRSSDKESWTSSNLGTEGVYTKSGSAGRSAWPRTSSREGGSYSYNDDSTGGHDSSRSVSRTRSSRKDVPCKFHQKGYCRRGDSCDFWHG